jgi:hypothetical protein
VASLVEGNQHSFYLPDDGDREDTVLKLLAEQLTTDGHRVYLEAVEAVFGSSTSISRTVTPTV